jgi:tRNA (mo5U34)-methyltransferase
MNGTSTSPQDPANLHALATGPGWYHSIDLGDGIVTRGSVPIDFIPDALLPEMSNRSVLDIGAWDGGNAFRAERLGAKRVVALDHYVWGVDLPRRQHYWDECAAAGKLPDQTLDETEFWDASLPGKKKFDIAHAALNSSVEAVVADFMTMDLASLGTFDVVLYLGILYHMKEPLTVLERVHHVTNEVAVIETEAVHVRGQASEPLLKFLAGNELRRDFGNWYLVSETALHRMCLAAGFSKVATKRGFASRRNRWTKATANYRLLLQAFV